MRRPHCNQAAVKVAALNSLKRPMLQLFTNENADDGARKLKGVEVETALNENFPSFAAIV